VTPFEEVKNILEESHYAEADNLHMEIVAKEEGKMVLKEETIYVLRKDE